MNKPNRKKALNILFLITIFVLTIWLVFRGENFREVLFLLSHADPLYIIPGFLCVILFILGESVVICYLMRTLGTKVSFPRCCRYSFIGFFYSSITPSASGGQPMQMLAMREDHLPVAISTVVLAIVTITYKLVLVLIGLAVLLIRPQQMMFYLDPVAPFMVLGLVLNILCVTALLLLVFHPDLVRFLARQLFSLWGKLRPIRNPEKQTARLERVVAQYQGSAEYFRTHQQVIVKVFFITLLQRCFLFSVTWLTYRAFSLSGHSMLLILSLQAMIAMAADMLPLPGGMGVSEALFLEVFLPIFGDALVLPGMVISRGIGYYTQLLLCGLCIVLSSLFLKEKDRKAEKRNDKIHRSL